MYNIYSGFYRNPNPHISNTQYGGLGSDQWLNIWYSNTQKFSKNTQINLFGPDIPSDDRFLWIRQIADYPNLGHVGDYLNGSRQGKWCGWTAGVVFGMMHAYLNNVDFLYKEQDCLWFGEGIVDQLYQDIGNSDIVVGSCKLIGVAQSLFLVKRNAIPAIIASLAQDDDKDVLPEYKFARLPNHAKLSFGYDRDRPFNTDDKHWYIQQVSKEELDLLRTEGLI